MKISLADKKKYLVILNELALSFEQQSMCIIFAQEKASGIIKPVLASVIVKPDETATFTPLAFLDPALSKNMAPVFTKNQETVIICAQSNLDVKAIESVDLETSKYLN